MIEEEKCKSMWTSVTRACGVTNKQTHIGNSSGCRVLMCNFVQHEIHVILMIFQYVSHAPCDDFLQASDSVDSLGERSCSQHQSSRGKWEK